jgi:hypothetical protein
MKHSVLLPLLRHVIGVPQGREPSGQRLRWFDLQEGGSFRHFPSDKLNQHYQPAKVELVSLILSFTTIFLKLVDEVACPVHVHSLHAFSCEVHHEPGDLCGMVLSYKLASYELASEAHCTILDRGYLVASLSFFNSVVSLLDALCQGAIRGLP